MEQQTVSKEKTLGAKAAIATILAAIILFAVVGIIVGKFLFWNNYSQLSKNDYALRQNLERIKSDPMNPDKLVNLGWTYFQLKDYEKAITYYKQALKYDDKHFSAYVNLGLAYMNNKQMTKAEESFKKALDIIPKSEVAHLNLGMLYIKLEKYAEARNELDIAYRSNPGSVETLYNLGLTYEKTGDKEKAADLYNEAASYDPNYKLAKDGLNRIRKK